MPLLTILNLPGAHELTVPAGASLLAALQTPTSDPVAPSVAAQAAPADPAQLSSTMAGTVVKWLVADGDSVTDGAAVLVLEAMKMESTVTAHRAGTMGLLQVQPGDSVALHDVVASVLD